MANHIEKRLELKVPVSRAWRALTDAREFGEWFGVQLETPFVPGRISSGQITHPAYSHLVLEVAVQNVEPERLFSYTWHPYAVDLQTDYSNEAPTLVEFRLEETGSGTLLLLSESGFEQIPSDRRLEAFRMNDDGWTKQMENIEKYVTQNP